MTNGFELITDRHDATSRQGIDSGEAEQGGAGGATHQATRPAVASSAIGRQAGPGAGLHAALMRG
ncbi:hypothetical protein CH75_07640 [Dyella jiangningensis]|nr:hypothetical protein CH75_07640 [Dyella jiangningensis]